MSNSVIPYSLSSDNAPAYWLVDILWLIHATGEQTGGSYTMMEEFCPGGSGPPSHTHTQDEAFYLIEGEATFFAAGKAIKATPGTSIAIPRGTVHSFTIDSPTAHILNYYMPAGFENIIMGLAIPAKERVIPPPNLPLPDRKLVEELSRRYGQVSVGGLPFADAPTTDNMKTH